MTTGRINQVDERAETRRKANQPPRFAVTIGTQKTELRRWKAQKRNPVEKGRASQTMGEATRATLRQFCLCAPIEYAVHGTHSPECVHGTPPHVSRSRRSAQTCSCSWTLGRLQTDAMTASLPIT